jgi:hypothetical protein
MSTTPIRTTAAALAGAALLGVAGCGGSDEAHVNNPRPPSPLTISASITPSRITVSPTEIGAGPISLVVANISGSEQRVTLESADAPGSGPGTTRSSQPIEPSGTGVLKAEVEQGSYTVRVEGDAISPAGFEVGPDRPSAQNDVGIP